MKKLLFSLWLACVAPLALAQSLQAIPPATAHVIDQTGALDAAAKQGLEAKLSALEATRGSQVVVLIVPTTQPEDIAAYANRVADSWKIGRKDVGDGLLIIVAQNDRKMRIEVSRALEGAIPDLMANRIINENMKPAFRTGDFAGGLGAAVDSIDKLIAGENLPQPTAAQAGGAMGGGGLDEWLPLLLFGLFAFPILASVLRGLFGRGLGSMAAGGVVGGLGYLLTTSLGLALGLGLIGGIVALFMGAFSGLASAVNAGRGGGYRGGYGRGYGRGHGGGYGGGYGGGGFGGGGGGFSSGGGGSFGGGGASGDW